ncbi:hypothetical protein HDE_03810 [Halotydeus destructor]|nr:hypothetical protein HDE_03810 [Halotydeus destructor]
MRSHGIIANILPIFVGMTTWSWVHWSWLVAPDVTAYCAPPDGLAAQWSNDEWKVFGLVSHPRRIGHTNRTLRDFEFDQCTEQAVSELFEPSTRTIKDVIEVGNVVNCQAGWTYEPAGLVSLVSEFNLVCTDGWLLPLADLITGSSAIVASIFYFVMSQTFDLRWTESSLFRGVMAFSIVVVEWIALYSSSQSFLLLLLLRSSNSSFMALFGYSTVVLFFRHSNHDWLTTLALVIGGWLIAAINWSMLIWSVSDWRQMAAMCICIPFTVTAVISLFLPQSNDANNHDFEMVYSKQCKEISSGMFAEKHQEQVISTTLIIRTLDKVVFLVRLFVSAILYIAVYSAKVERSCFVRTSGQSWCFVQRPFVEMLTCLLVLKVRFVFNLTTARKVVLFVTAISTVSLIVISGIHACGDTLYSTDAIEVIATCCAMVCACAVFLHSVITVVELGHHKFCFFAILIAMLGQSVARSVSYMSMDNISSKLIAFSLMCSTLSLLNAFELITLRKKK